MQRIVAKMQLRILANRKISPNLRRSAAYGFNRYGAHTVRLKPK